MNILAFGASNSKNSINKALAAHAGQLLQAQHPDVTLEVLDLNDFEMPIYSVDREQADGIPALAQQFYDKIGQADAIIVSFAEYNGSYTSAWKNTFDWMSRINMKVFQDKPMLVMAMSPGGRGGANVLGAVTATAPFFGMDIKGELAVPNFGENFDLAKGELTNPDLQKVLAEALTKLV